MSYLVRQPYDASLAEIDARFRAYRASIESASQRKRMPSRALEFAVASWHYDHNDHRCPHDAWVESIRINEPSSGTRREIRSVDIRIELLGAYHDGHIVLTYPGVRMYSLFQPLGPGLHPPLHRGHGDWLIDEISPSNNGNPEAPLIVHEIVFSGGGLWTIEADDIIYQWIPDKA